MNNKIKVLIIDDSALVRKIFTNIIESDHSLEVLGSAPNGKIGLRKIVDLNPDIVTLDIEMPELDGFGVLDSLSKMQIKPKIIMVSSLTEEGAETTFKALEMGAVDFITKPSARSNDLNELSASLLKKIQTIANIDSRVIVFKSNIVQPVLETPIKKVITSSTIPTNIIAIGTSTGGPQALKEIFSNPNLPVNAAYLIVQHMPAEFTKPFAHRLNQLSKINVNEAENNDQIIAGKAYLAPGHSHLEIIERNNNYYTKLSQTDKVSGHRPSIDVLFNSVANVCSKRTVAVIMTGMGRDGASGMKNIFDKGGKTISQDKDSSVVFGMNKEAIQLGGIQKIVCLRDIPQTINQFIKEG